jgi:DNA-binding beta-propeller fold protein YncE
LGIGLDSSNNLYVPTGTNIAYRFTSAGVSLAPVTLTGLYQGGCVAVDNTNSYLYVSDYYTGINKVWRYVLGTGTASGAAVTGQSGVGFNFASDPVGMAVDSSGDLYVGDYLNSAIQEFTSSGAPVTVWTLPNAPNYPLGVAVGPTSGYVYVTSNSGQIIKYLPPNGAPITVVNTTVGLAPIGIALDSSENIYVANFNYTNIQEFSPSGAHLATIGSYGQGNGEFGSTGDPYGPEFLAVDSSGNLIATDPYNQRIETFGP